MPKDDLVYIGHMLDKAMEALNLAQGKSQADYDRDKTLQLALTFLIQVIGEAARHVSPGFRQLHPEVPWDAIMGMRHKIVHDYMDVDEDIGWDTVTEELAPLIETLKKLMPSESC
ncbi:MAG: HepT-like ribonuclease domain-containing protein [Nitrospirales bacterium]